MGDIIILVAGALAGCAIGNIALMLWRDSIFSALDRAWDFFNKTASHKTIAFVVAAALVLAIVWHYATILRKAVL